MSTIPENIIYNEDNIRSLDWKEHIRLRPGMYIGDTGTNGLHHLIYELVHNCVDEALAGYCHNINVRLQVDNSCSVSDDGRREAVGGYNGRSPSAHGCGALRRNRASTKPVG